MIGPRTGDDVYANPTRWGATAVMPPGAGAIGGQNPPGPRTAEDDAQNVCRLEGVDSIVGDWTLYAQYGKAGFAPECLQDIEDVVISPSSPNIDLEPPLALVISWGVGPVSSEAAYPIPVRGLAVHVIGSSVTARIIRYRNTVGAVPWRCQATPGIPTMSRQDVTCSIVSQQMRLADFTTSVDVGNSGSITFRDNAGNIVLAPTASRGYGIPALATTLSSTVLRSLSVGVYR